jgi:FMN phosphatase YigB (HAD superfamily)
MKLTLLLDLDDTLLETNMDTFLPGYFKALSKALAKYIPPEAMLPALQAGTGAMLVNTDPGRTLREIFDAYFFPKLGIDRPTVQAVIDTFYDEDFPALGSLTRPIPEAVRLVDWAFAQGYTVAIATNPIFPRKATYHRLRWAGLPPEKYPFALVSSYEYFHFAKEKVAYYPEVLAQLGWPADPVVMVGDDYEREVKPIQAAGLSMYWVRKGGEYSADLAEIPQGSLAGFRDWLQQADPTSLRLSLAAPSAVIACLRSTPAALATVTAEQGPGTWSQRPRAGEWCLTEILCHLRDTEREVHVPRLKKILGEANPFIPGEETDRWAAERNYAAQDGRQALADFLSARKETLSLLEGLQVEWSRPARHSIFGPTTLQELVVMIAEHDQAHVAQVWKTIRTVELPQDGK